MLQTDLKFAEIALLYRPASDLERTLDLEYTVFSLEPFFQNGAMDRLAADAEDLGRLSDGIPF